LVGKTPLLRLERVFPNLNVLGKCEFMNPFSIKDRAVLQIFQDAEERGELKRGDTVIECTSGNTGLAVAFISAIKAYKAILVMSEIQSIERRQIMKALGAKLVLTPAKLGTEGARQKLKEILKENPKYFYVGQHIRKANPKAHYLTTGPEIWKETEGEIDILIAGLGTGGTICGAGRYLKEKKKTVKLIAVEPYESPYISKIIDEIVLIKEKEAFQMCRELAKKEGILVGISSGATCKAAEKIGKRKENKEKMIVVILADTGQRYLSVEGLYNV